MSKITDFFASVKLTIFLLVLLAAASIIGTVIPQQEPFTHYVRLYGEDTARLFQSLFLFEMYRSPWFIFLLAFLGINLVVCSFKRFPKTWRMVRAEPGMSPRDFSKMALRMENSVKTLASDYEDRVRMFLSQKLGKPKTARFEDGVLFFAEKGRWTRLGVYVVHFSVLLLFAGAIIGALFGFKGSVNILEGETVHEIFVRGKKEPMKLDFGVRCDRFTVKFYPSGAPELFRSDLTFIKNGKDVFHYPLKVNDPVTFGGITFYQSSYGVTLGGEITLELIERESGKRYVLTGNPDHDFRLPNGKGRFRIINYHSNLMRLGPAVKIHLLDGTAGHSSFWIFKNHPNFDKRRKGTYVFQLKENREVYYTGLQTNRDPGVWVIYTGFSLIVLGLLIVFFTSHRTLWVQVRKKGKAWQMIVAGSANKNRPGYKMAFEKWCRQLKELQK